MTSLDLAGDPQGQLLERMKSEFLAAQQRRRNQAPPPRPDDTNGGPFSADPDGEGLAIAADVRPCPPSI